MSDIPLTAQIAALACLLLLSGLFSLAETAMMAANRYRLRSLANQGNKGAHLALALLAKTDDLLGVILLFNNLINAAAATLVSVITIHLFGNESWALGAGTLAVTFLILVFSEITPKVIGANHADRLAPVVSFGLAGLLRVFLFSWAVGFINLFVNGLVSLLRLRPKDDHARGRLSPEELRVLVLESGQFIPPAHREILLNLFELEDITVEDVMTPRGEVEAINLAAPADEIRSHLASSYHTRLPVFDGDMDRVVGILQMRSVLTSSLDSGFEIESLRDCLATPYFIPTNTRVYSQLQFFQQNHQRIGLVVDEYGEFLGVLTLEDIVRELIGKFASSALDNIDSLAWQDGDSVLVSGSQNLRALNRKLGLKLPVDGPKTLNGLIVEYLGDIPEAGLSVRIAGVPIEVVQTEDRRVCTARVFRPQSPKPKTPPA